MFATRTARGDRGQAVMLVLGVLAVLAALLVGLAHFGARLVRIEQAQAAADAAALAGVVDGEGAAAALAARNGARLVSFDQRGDDVVVAVERRGVRAVARATRAP